MTMQKTSASSGPWLGRTQHVLRFLNIKPRLSLVGLWTQVSTDRNVAFSLNLSKSTDGKAGPFFFLLMNLQKLSCHSALCCLMVCGDQHRSNQAHEIYKKQMERSEGSFRRAPWGCVQSPVPVSLGNTERSLKVSSHGNLQSFHSQFMLSLCCQHGEDLNLNSSSILDQHCPLFWGKKKKNQNSRRFLQKDHYHGCHHALRAPLRMTCCPKQRDTSAWLGKVQLHLHVACCISLFHFPFFFRDPDVLCWFSLPWLIYRWRAVRNLCSGFVTALRKPVLAALERSGCYGRLLSHPHEPWHGPALSKESPSRSRVLDVAAEPPLNTWSKRGGEVGPEGSVSCACASLTDPADGSAQKRQFGETPEDW